MRMARFEGTKGFHLFLVVALLAASVAVLLPPRPAHAAPDATFTVDSTADVNDATPGDGNCDDGGGHCTLRAAISEANALAGADTISLPAGTYILTITGNNEQNNATGDLDITNNSEITINGAGADTTIIQVGSGGERAFDVVGSDDVLALVGLTVRDGQANGGGVYTSGTLTVTDSIVTSNHSGVSGGGLYMLAGTMAIENSTISDNTATNAGGGIYLYEGTLHIESSLISGNSVEQYDGGGVYNFKGTLTINHSTFSNNSASSYGGGLYIQNTATIENSTFSGNSSNNGGGVAMANQYHTLTVRNSTFSSNSASLGGGLTNELGTTVIENCTFSNNSALNGDGVARTSGSVSMKNSILADECYGTITSEGYNLVKSGTSCPSDGTGDQVTSNPKLAALADNGGPTETRALQYGSPAVDAIPAGTNGCGTDTTSDQRGEPRPTGGLCDVGAYESPFIYWDDGGAGDHNTSTAENWRGDILPGPANIPVFYNIGGVEVTVDADLTVAGWVVDDASGGGITLWPNPRLMVNGDWLHLDGYFTGDYYGRIDVAGAFHMSGGQFVVSPNYCIDCNGWLKVGGGIYHTGGNFDADSGSIILDTGDQTLMTTATLGDLYINDGLLGYWKLDEGTGSTTADSSGYHNYGTLSGDPAWRADTPGTDFGNPYALDFDGAGDYVAIDGVAAEVGGAVSIALWVKAPSDSGGIQSLLAVNTASQGNVVVLGIRDADEYKVLDGGSGVWEGDTNTDVADGTWHHLAYTSDGVTGRLYVDGAAKATHTPNYSFSSDDLWSLGQEWDTGGPSDFLNGLLDDVRVYNRALSGTEIQALADGGHPQTSVATISLGSALNIEGDLTLNSGTLNVSASNYGINVAGDFVRNGGVFNARSGTVTFNGSGTQNLDTDAITFYNLTVNSSSTLVHVNPGGITVNGTLTNNGALQQTRDVASSTAFLNVKDSTGTIDKYLGAEINPAASMGSTTVTIRGNQLCPNANSGVQRCFELDPTTSQAATVKFYYTEAERNGQDNAAMNVYHWNGSSWDLEPGSHSRGGSGDGQWVQVEGVDAYSPFALGNGGPTAVTLSSFTARAAEGAVLLEWETASEVNLSGVHVYSAEAPDGLQTRLNAALIPAQAPGSPVGGIYEFVDEAVAPGVTYWYWLEAVDTYDQVTFYGPVSIQVSPGSLYHIYLPLVRE